ncbi:MULTISPECIES: primosomal replication protein PriC [unclassified Colwellia]|jgi:primosomal replication protein N''|uniref:primosomal replication protein PriC n=1 Tax=unclassified Colwellia TaxID=196834 RepID=UPI000D3A6A53|nr:MULTISPECIES: primosomal replication protein PriC [unclassified Colwellia]AWB56937.1 primosomal replication protein N'' [Colwellia sp. Arc7-D]MBA6416904.1 primosomal replication protein [Colwellia sp. 6M3]|tara:strand:- start:1870 stop:2472 length:603 start_codon:yes stop_codon:yes gene_type:complete
MQSAINKIHAILDQIDEQAKLVDQQNKHSKSHKIIQENDIFSEKLFLTHSDQFHPYVAEVKDKTNELSRLLTANKNTLAHSRLLIIEQQISALRNALNSNSTLHKEPAQRLVAIKSRRFKKAAQAVMQSSHNLHNKLNETFEFERRLLEMIEIRERQMHGAPANKSKQLTDETLALHQRLGRCRQAISKLEREISKSEQF